MNEHYTGACAALRMIRSHLDGYRFLAGKGREAQFQEQLLTVLGDAEPEALWVREHRVEGGRLDLYSLAWGIAIETKVGAQAFAEVLTQVAGYLIQEQVTGLLVVTRRHALRSLPAEVHGKPLSVYWIGAQL